jgi:U3 small nucleolar RNA-associated protein 3
VKLKKTKQGKGVVLPAPEAEADGGEEKKEGSGADEAENGERSTLPDLGGADAEVERVSKDVSKLSSDEKLELVRRDAPELLALVEELKQKTREVREKLAPLLERARQKGAAETAKGVSLLEVKYHALLHYVTLLAFFLLLKAEGRTVKDHPVVKRLVSSGRALAPLSTLR